MEYWHWISGVSAIVGLDRGRAFYPTVLIVIASCYPLFAVMGGSTHALWPEIVFATLVSVVAIPWLVAVAMVGHGVFDVLRHLLALNHGLPAWWPGLCLTFDAFAGAWMAMLPLLRSRRPLRAVG